MVDTVLEQLIIKIGTDIVDLKKGVAESNENLDKLSKKSQAMSSSVSSSFRAVQSAAIKMAAVFGISLGVQGVVGAITRSVQSLVDLERQSKSLGVTAQEMAKLKFVANSVGVEFEQLQQAFSKLAIGLQAGRFNETTVALANLGIRTKDLVTGQLRALPDILTDVAAAFQRLPKGIQQSQLAIQLFGESGLKILPFLLKGPAGIKALGDELERLGGVPTKEAVTQAVELDQTWKRLVASSDALVTKVTLSLIPVMKTTAESFEKAAKEGTLLQTALSLLGSLGLPGPGGSDTTFGQRLMERMGWNDPAISKMIAARDRQAAAVRAAEELTGGMVGASAQQLKDLIAQEGWQTKVNNALTVGTLTTERLNELKGQGQALTEAGLTPLEAFVKLQNDLNLMQNNGVESLITQEAAQRALTAAWAEYISQQEQAAESLGVVFTLQEKQEQSIRKIEEAYRSGKITAEQYGRAQLSVAQQTQQAYASAASALANSAAAVFNKSKAVSVAAAIISTYEAANKAMTAFPGPPVSFAYVAAALATGFANVRNILATTQSGGPMSGSSGNAGATAAAAAPAAQESSRSITIQGVDRASLFSGSQVEGLIDALNAETSRGKTLIATQLRPT